MATLDHKKFLSMSHIYDDRIRKEVNDKMSALMFEPITDETEIANTLNSRSGKGETEAFLNGAETAYQEYIKKNPGGHFILPLNEKEGAKFYGKSTDSLYATIHGVLKKKELTTLWRLVRVKKANATNDGEDTFLRLVHL